MDLIISLGLLYIIGALGTGLIIFKIYDKETLANIDNKLSVFAMMVIWPIILIDLIGIALFKSGKDNDSIN